MTYPNRPAAARTVVVRGSWSDAALTWAVVMVVLYRANRRSLPPARALIAWWVWQLTSRAAYLAGRVALAAEHAYRSGV